MEDPKGGITEMTQDERWQIRYQEVIHAGTHPLYLDMLLENIHAFYDIFMRELLIDVTDKGMMKLEYSYILRQSLHNSCLSYLETLNNSTTIDENNYLQVLGIK